MPDAVFRLLCSYAVSRRPLPRSIYILASFPARWVCRQKLRFANAVDVMANLISCLGRRAESEERRERRAESGERRVIPNLTKTDNRYRCCPRAAFILLRTEPRRSTHTKIGRPRRLCRSVQPRSTVVGAYSAKTQFSPNHISRRKSRRSASALLR